MSRRRTITWTKNFTLSSMLSILIFGLSPRCYLSYSKIFMSFNSLSSCSSSSLLSYFSNNPSSYLLFSSPCSNSLFLLVKASSRSLILVVKFWESMSQVICWFWHSNCSFLTYFSSPLFNVSNFYSCDSSIEIWVVNSLVLFYYWSSVFSWISESIYCSSYSFLTFSAKYRSLKSD